MEDLLMGSDDKDTLRLQFESYVLSFYNRDSGIYPFNCSDDTIIAAIEFVETACLNSETFAADIIAALCRRSGFRSIYREKVRAVLEAVGYREQVATQRIHLGDYDRVEIGGVPEIAVTELLNVDAASCSCGSHHSEVEYFLFDDNVRSEKVIAEVLTPDKGPAMKGNRNPFAQNSVRSMKPAAHTIVKVKRYHR